MKDPQHIFNAWRALMYLINIPFIMFLLYYAVNPKELERWRHKSSRYRPSDSSYVFMRIVFVISAIGMSVVLVKISLL